MESKPIVYVLITPARNEASHLPALLDSVVTQTIRPAKWIIVDDGSTDATADILAQAVKNYPFIQFISAKNESKRSFGSKAKAFQAGCALLRDLSYDFIGNLDADVTFDSNFYTRLIDEMNRNSKLGIASGSCWEKINGQFQMITTSSNHAVGAVQFFRRKCFEDVGGYQPASVGGIDSLAERTARMKGWETKAFFDLPFYHHKPVDSANARSAAQICYRAGLTEYHIGTHPVFAMAKAVRRWKERPIFFGMWIRMYAYGKLWLTGAKRDASDELVAYLKNEQLGILKDALLGRRKF